MHGQIDPSVMERRKEEILFTQQQISLENGKVRTGKVMEVFVEGYVPDEQVWVGRTYADAPDVDGLFFLSSSAELHSGDLVRAMVTGSSEYDLMGEYEDEHTEEYESAE